MSNMAMSERSNVKERLNFKGKEVILWHFAMMFIIVLEADVSAK